MKKFLSELILPAFWLFFFIISSTSNNKLDEFKNMENTDLKKANSKQDYAAINKLLKSTQEVTKAMYLTKF